MYSRVGLFPQFSTRLSIDRDIDILDISVPLGIRLFRITNLSMQSLVFTIALPSMFFEIIYATNIDVNLNSFYTGNMFL